MNFEAHRAREPENGDDWVQGPSRDPSLCSRTLNPSKMLWENTCFGVFKRSYVGFLKGATLLRCRSDLSDISGSDLLELPIPYIRPIFKALM
jgi:hypothetical protein